jgi:hypothetical protein
MDECTAEIFAADVRHHRMEMLHSDEIYRHLRFSRAECSVNWFELITWPGVLTINGDMGTYTFSRLEDMFEFFRRPDNGINVSYWAEKCTSVDRHGPMTEWCQVESRKQLAETIEDWPAKARHEAFERLNPESFDSEQEFRVAVEDFDFELDGETFRIYDFWEFDLSRDSYRFVWCLRAISWGIQQFNKIKNENKEANE